MQSRPDAFKAIIVEVYFSPCTIFAAFCSKLLGALSGNVVFVQRAEDIYHNLQTGAKSNGERGSHLGLQYS